MRIKWLQTAINSFDKAMAHIAQEDEDAARRISDYIEARVKELLEQPRQGRPGRILGTRELVIGKFPFIIPYRVKGDEVQILRVFHTSRNPPDTW